MIYTASLTCANPLRLEEDVRALLEGGIDTLHLDLMDGHHVPALGLNVETVRQLHRVFPQAVLDAHLMVQNPAHYYEAMAEAGVQWLTIVPQTVAHPAEALREIRRLGMRPGFALNPEVPIEEVEPLLPLAALVVVMSITPGGYGRPFQPEAYGRIDTLHRLRETQGYDYLISVDGGITLENGMQCREHSADMLVEGVFTLFRQPQGIRQACLDYIRKMGEEEPCNCS